MRFMKNTKLGLCGLLAGALSLLTLGMPAEAAPQAALQLAQNQRTAYVIALAADAIPAEKTAAEQLQKYLLQVTGATFPIQAETEAAAGTAGKAAAPQILVGAGKRAKALLPQQDWSSLGKDGIVIKTVGSNLILAGGRPRGTLYAVFQFLEESAGCRWWTPTENTIPTKSTLVVQPQNVAYVPTFSYREHFTTAVQDDPAFATAMRENGHFQKQGEEWGGHYNLLGFVHTFSKLLPPEKYFKEHPEWYSDPDNGNKPASAASKMPAAQQTQLCLSNPQVLEELTKEALAWIAKNPEAGYISISQNDNHNYCQDAESMKLAEAEGSQAGPLLQFINSVAEKIHQQYPDFKVETLAYYYSEKPPKTIRPGKNVIVRLAPLAADFGHPLNSERNAETRDNFLAWSKIAPELLVWNYVTNFTYTMFPQPNWAGLGQDLRFFAANKVQGVFEQGDNYTNGVGDFVQLRAWLIGKLMWNPALDQDKLTTEFLGGYYGAAGPFLKQYLDLVQKSYLAENRKLSASNSIFSFLTLDVANESIRLFQQAADAVKGDKALADRVRRERLSLEIGLFYRYNALKQTAAVEGKPFLGPEDPNLAMAEFIKTAKAFGVRNWGEGVPFEKQIPRLQNMFAAAVNLPEFAQKFPATDVIDIQQGHFSLLPQKKLSDVAADPAASDGKAGSMVGATTEWAIQAKLGQFLESDGKDKWRVYAMARIELKDGATPTKTAAFRSGIYDLANRATISTVAIAPAKVRGEQYLPVDLGAYPLNGGMYIWFAPVNDPAVERIYIDRIILIRQK